MRFRSGEASVLIGTRSAALLPAHKLGMIILDEEHDSSFKQQEGFRFSARDISVMRGRMANIPVVMGSATPSLESLHNAALDRYEHLHLPKRAGQAEPPLFQVVDIRSQYLEQGLSSQLKGLITETLSRKEQALLFVNRRGFAPTLICNGCGWVAGCPHCDARMVIHKANQKLVCHHCGYEQRSSEICPSCKLNSLTPLGQGTERIEATLNHLFPNARIARIDRDTTQRKGALDAHLANIQSGETDILVGTQMLAKGHHFPNVTLVGILDADAGLYSLDFRAEERTAQLITQVAGRCGRGDKRGRVIIQTRHPDHLLIQVLTRQSYGDFASRNLEDRKACGLPPYSFQALWRADSKSQTIARDMLEQMAETLRARSIEQLQILGPAPSPMEKRSGRYRWQLLLQSKERRTLHEAVLHLTRFLDQYPSKPRDFRYSVDIDPIELI
jgi:primosomal protein N' (replication factor Y)